MKPVMLLKGVRISWLMTARNSDLASLAPRFRDSGVLIVAPGLIGLRDQKLDLASDRFLGLITEIASAARLKVRTRPDRSKTTIASIVVSTIAR